MPDGETLVVANGGIETHPDTGRTRLNLAMMRPNLNYLRLDGRQVTRFELPSEHRLNSIRHLAVAKTGAVAFAMQWQGDLYEDLPLLGVHHVGTGEVQLAPEASVRRMDAYLGSVAMAADGVQVATTSPRKGRLQVFSGGQLWYQHTSADVCGVATLPEGFLTTAGTGHVATTEWLDRRHAFARDNHLVTLL